jgi:oxygen-independent coproporphyrinogen-3 oxidase
MPPTAGQRLTELTRGGTAFQEETRARRTIEVALAASGREPADGRPAGLYLHVPFCFHKCHYCDFYSIVDGEHRQAAFVDRLIEELDAASRCFDGAAIETIFVGGGTPTLLAPSLWQRLLAALHERIAVSERTEFTVEANPETVTAEVAETLRRGGVNRVSIGAQSFDGRHLRTLERWHEPASVPRSVSMVRAAGIANINLDLIFAIPGQSLADWAHDLDAALALEPEHLSCYGLTYEPNTPMARRLKRGEFRRADEDLEAAMFEMAIEHLAARGFEQYEVSAHARPGRRCRHNLLYWTGGEWWGLGPGAAGHVAGVRWKNVPRLTEYLERGPLPPVTEVEVIDAGRRAAERLMLGLRLRDGIAAAELSSLLQSDPDAGRRAAAIDRQVRCGALERTNGMLRLTRSGLFIADTVIADLL